MLDFEENTSEEITGKELLRRLHNDLEKFGQILEINNPILRNLLTLQSEIQKHVDFEVMEYTPELLEKILCNKITNSEKNPATTLKKIKLAIRFLKDRSRMKSILSPEDVTTIICKLSDYVRRYMKEDFIKTNQEEYIDQLEPMIGMCELCNHEYQLLKHLSKEAKIMTRGLRDQIQELEGLRFDIEEALENDLNEEQIKKLKKNITIKCRRVEVADSKRMAEPSYSLKISSVNHRQNKAA